jgi:hypothetical protein
MEHLYTLLAALAKLSGAVEADDTPLAEETAVKAATLLEGIYSEDPDMPGEARQMLIQASAGLFLTCLGACEGKNTVAAIRVLLGTHKAVEIEAVEPEVGVEADEQAE